MSNDYNHTVHPSRIQCDHPPYSRLFILCDKSLNEYDLRCAFSTFGEIQDVWIVRDVSNHQSRGMAYLKYAKTSSAAVAIEEMDGKVLGDNQKSLKCLIAQSKNSKCKNDFVEDSARTRLFVVCPRDYTEEDLKEKFIQFGHIEYCQIVKDRTTKQSKGLGYVKFSKASAAAVALENCDTSFRAILAEPKSSKTSRNADINPNSASMDTANHTAILNCLPAMLRSALLDHEVKCLGSAAIVQKTIDNLVLDNPLKSNRTDSKNKGIRLFVIVASQVTQEQLFRLFDIVPGMQSCKLKKDHQTGRSKGFAYVTYSSLTMAAYALEKLHGIEYPAGSKIVVKYAEDPPSSVKLHRHNHKPIQPSSVKSTLNFSADCSTLASVCEVNDSENKSCTKRSHENDKFVQKDANGDSNNTNKRLKPAEENAFIAVT